MTSDQISGDTYTSKKTTVEHKINELIAWLHLTTSGKHFSCIWDDTKITSIYHKDALRQKRIHHSTLEDLQLKECNTLSFT
jgi:hypothetical protein